MNSAFEASVSLRRPKGHQHDPWLLVSAGLLTVTGFLAIYSVTPRAAFKQMIFAALGVLVFLVFNRVKLDWWRSVATPLYVLNLLMLTATLFVGSSVGVAQRWIQIGSFQFQPSELSKVLLAITLAAYFANRQDKVTHVSTLVGAILHLAPVLFLIYAQPHLGATLAVLFMGVAAAIYAGVPWKFFPLVTACTVLLGVALWTTPGLMSEYQKNRGKDLWTKVVKKEVDRKGKDWQTTNSIIAIGSGGVSGEGYLNGPQKELGLIPVQESDFVFSVIGEEGGFIGSVTVLALFGFFVYRVWLRAFRARTAMGRITSGALLAVLVFHFVVNMAMVLSIGPVVGLWLPFVSSGGTALWMCFASVGLVDQAE